MGKKRIVLIDKIAFYDSGDIPAREEISDIFFFFALFFFDTTNYTKKKEEKDSQECERIIRAPLPASQAIGRR